MRAAERCFVFLRVALAAKQGRTPGTWGRSVTSGWPERGWRRRAWPSCSSWWRWLASWRFWQCGATEPFWSRPKWIRHGAGTQTQRHCWLLRCEKWEKCEKYQKSHTTLNKQITMTSCDVTSGACSSNVENLTGLEFLLPAKTEHFCCSPETEGKYYTDLEHLLLVLLPCCLGWKIKIWKLVGCWTFNKRM